MIVKQVGRETGIQVGREAGDPETGFAYAYVMYIIENGADINERAEGYSLDDLGINAIDTTTIEFKLAYTAVYFPSITAMWTSGTGFWILACAVTRKLL